MGERHLAQGPVALYGVHLLLAALSYYLLQGQVVGANAHQPGCRAALSGYPVVAFAILAAVAPMWLIPDRRMERINDNRTPTVD